MSAHSHAKKTQKAEPYVKFTEYNRPQTLWERIYLGPVASGLWQTFKHFYENFFFKKRYVVIEYPEEKREVSSRWRGRHRLTTRTGGTLTCVACKMCEMVCPANCITIEAGERPEPYETKTQKIDKYPLRFEINLAKCIYCGLCVEACPEDALRMDSGIISLVGYDRNDLLIDRDGLTKLDGVRHEVVYRELSYPPEDRLPDLEDRYVGKRTIDQKE